MYSQCLMDYSQSCCKLSTLPMALCASRLTFSKGSSSSLLLKCRLQTAMALATLSGSISAILSSRISCKVCLRSPSSSSDIFLSATLKSPLSIKMTPSAYVRKLLSRISFSGMASWEKGSKMLSILLFSFCGFWETLRVMLPTEFSQQRALSSNFFSRFRQRPTSWLISSLMSHLGLVNSSFSRAIASSRFLWLGSRIADTFVRQNCAMMLSGVFLRTARKSPSASAARSWQNLWKRGEFLSSMELSRQMARLKVALASAGSTSSTLRLTRMASSISPLFLKQMPMLTRESRQRVPTLAPCCLRAITCEYSSMASSFSPMTRQRLARLQ